MTISGPGEGNHDDPDLLADSTTSDGAPPRTLEELVEPGSVVLLVTVPLPAPVADDPAGYRAARDLLRGASGRPLTCADVRGSTVRFLVDGTADWVEDLDSGGEDFAALLSADPGRSTYLSASGVLHLRSGRAEVDELWNLGAAAFFDGPDDPRVTIVEFEAESGEWWAGPPTALGRALSVVKAAVLNRPDQAGDHGPLA